MTEKLQADEQPVESAAVEDGNSELPTFFANVLPWMISVMVHAGIVLLTIFVVWTSAASQEEGEEVIIPVARLGVKPGGSLVYAPKQSPLSGAIPSARAGVAAPTRKDFAETLPRGAGFGAGNGQGSGAGSGSGSGTGAGSGAGGLIGIGGGGGGGGRSPFASGSGGGGGGPFRASMYGTGGNARKIIYLIDASGSLIDTLPFVILELKRSINELSERQSFTVIFFQGDEAIEVPPAGLKVATLDIKQKVIQWLDPKRGNVIPRGKTNPLKALELALRYKPQLLFILSDNITGKGRYELDQRQLLAEIKRRNTGQTKINTIQFLYEDPLSRLGQKATLERISDETGGVYRFVPAEELFR